MAAQEFERLKNILLRVSDDAVAIRAQTNRLIEESRALIARSRKIQLYRYGGPPK
jgi:hypothetical protein